MTASWTELRRLFPWPHIEKEARVADVYYDGPGAGWLHPSTWELLSQELEPENTVVELGSWLGTSARAILDYRPSARLICVDHFEGSPEHHADPEWSALLPTLYPQFIRNMREYRDSMVVVRADRLVALRVLAKLVRPNVVYLDCRHDREAVQADVLAIVAAFPTLRAIVGDDWTWDGVRDGVTDAINNLKRSNPLFKQNLVELTTTKTGWKLDMRKGVERWLQKHPPTYDVTPQES